MVTIGVLFWSKILVTGRRRLCSLDVIWFFDLILVLQVARCYISTARKIAALREHENLSQVSQLNELECTKDKTSARRQTQKSFAPLGTC